jgi:tetratricopeptide (TPR) repeat protein
MALVPLLLFVWSSPENPVDNRASNGSSILADFSTGGAFSGFSTLINTVLHNNNNSPGSDREQAISWAGRLSLAREARMNGKLQIAKKEIRSALNLLVTNEYIDSDRRSDNSSLHISWPYNNALNLVLEEATEISRETADYNAAEKYSGFALESVEYSLKKNGNSKDLLLIQAKLLNTIASIKLQQAVFGNGTIQLINKAEEVLNKCTGPLHPERGAMFHNKAMVEHYRKNYKASIRLYLLAMSIRQQSNGEDSEITAETYGDLGLLYCEINDFNKGIPLVNHAIEIFSRNRNLHPWTDWYCDQMGYLLLKEGRFEDSVSYLKRANKGRKISLGKEHSLTRRTHQMLKSARHWAKTTQKTGNNEKKPAELLTIGAMPTCAASRR